MIGKKEPPKSKLETSREDFLSGKRNGAKQALVEQILQTLRDPATLTSNGKVEFAAVLPSVSIGKPLNPQELFLLGHDVVRQMNLSLEGAPAAPALESDVTLSADGAGKIAVSVDSAVAESYRRYCPVKSNGRAH